MKTIKVCAGIGDNIWLLKAIGSTGKYNYCLAGDEPKRGKQIFDLMPEIVEQSYYGSHGSSDVIRDNEALRVKCFADIKKDNFFLSINHHLEDGKRIEEYFPEIDMLKNLPIESSEHEEEAVRLLPDGNNYYGIYMSCYSILRHWKFWKENEWIDMIEKFYAEDNTAVFVMIGASFDIDLATNVCKILAERSIPYIGVIGQPLGLVCEIFKKLKYFLSFPSGMGILSTELGAPTYMFYPSHLEKMINAWARQDMLDSKKYYGSLFCDVNTAFNWIKNEYKLFA